MSYDIDLSIDTGGQERLLIEGNINYTYNVWPMLDKALGIRFTELNHYGAAELAPRLKRGCAHMIDNPQEYEELNPENGWGDAKGALKFLQDILALCEAHPFARLEIC
jgi:hypothetical protein